MRKKITLTIDSDVYDDIKDLPRSVSVSEIVSLTLKAILEDIKKGRELTNDELKEWIESDPIRKDIRDRVREQYGPSLKKFDDTINGIKDKILPKKK